jgi:hypothetical protein
MCMEKGTVMPILFYTYLKSIEDYLYTYIVTVGNIFFLCRIQSIYKKEVSCRTLTYQNISILNLGSHNISFCD